MEFEKNALDLEYQRLNNIMISIVGLYTAFLVGLILQISSQNFITSRFDIFIFIIVSIFVTGMISYLWHLMNNKLTSIRNLGRRKK